MDSYPVSLCCLKEWLVILLIGVPIVSGKLHAMKILC